MSLQVVKQVLLVTVAAAKLLQVQHFLKLQFVPLTSAEASVKVQTVYHI